jgi:hypothetical protein
MSIRTRGAALTFTPSPSDRNSKSARRPAHASRRPPQNH